MTNQSATQTELQKSCAVLSNSTEFLEIVIIKSAFLRIFQITKGRMTFFSFSSIRGSHNHQFDYCATNMQYLVCSHAAGSTNKGTDSRCI